MGTSSKKIAVIAALSTLIPNSALPQQSGGAVGASGQTYSLPNSTLPQQSGGFGGTGGTSYYPSTVTNPAALQLKGGLAAVQSVVVPRNPGGVQLDLDVSSKLSFDDNFKLTNKSGGTSSIWDTTLGFGLSSISASQSLNFTGSSVLRLANIPGRTIRGFEDPTLRLQYSLDRLNSRFSIDGRYRHADREFLDPFQVEQEEQALGQLIGGGGTVTWENIGATFQTGINDPIGFQLGLRHDARKYDALAQSVNPLLFDRRTNDAVATVTMRVSPVVQLRGTTGLTQYDARDSDSLGPLNTNRRTLDYALGAVLDINPVLQLDGQFGYTDVTTDTTRGRSTNSGASNALTLTQTLPNGSVYGSLLTTVNQNGTRTILSFGRDLQTPLGNFAGNLGVTNTPGGNNRLSGALSFTHTLISSDVTIRAARAVSTNGANQDILNTRIGVAYNYAVDNVSSVNLLLDWGRVESADYVPGYNSTNRTTLTAAYTRAVTQDWNLISGLQLRNRADTTGNAESNSIFMTLNRNFSYRP